MQLLLTRKVTKRLQRELRRAGSQEIGGLLMGEHVDDAVFRVIDISVQRSGGTVASFVRNPAAHDAELRAFFARTGEDYTRFNYLGEWHSHPSFEPGPSRTDMRTMQSIADDPDIGVNFVVLLILTLNGKHRIDATAFAFRPGVDPLPVAIVDEIVKPAQTVGFAYQRLLRFLGF